MIDLKICLEPGHPDISEGRRTGRLPAEAACEVIVRVESVQHGLHLAVPLAHGDMVRHLGVQEREQQPGAPRDVKDLEDRRSPVTIRELPGYRRPGPQTGVLLIVRRDLGPQTLTAGEHLERQLVGAGVIVAVDSDRSGADLFLERFAYARSRRHEFESALPELGTAVVAAVTSSFSATSSPSNGVK